jgi:hypothetical protein
MNFKQAYIGFMVVSLLLTIVFVTMFMRRGWCARAKEGFESGPEDANAVIEKGKQGLSALTGRLYGTIKFLDKFKQNYGNDFKKERMEMFSLSPVELARKHLQSQRPK